MRLALAIFASLILAAPVAALDCSKARSKIEKAICADSALAAADDAMSKAYADLRTSSADQAKNLLAQSQRKWIKGREQRCDYLDGPELKACILEETDDRRRLLLGAAESGPGAPSRITPLFIQKEPTAHTYDIDFSLLHFAEAKTAGEKAFNAEVDKIAALAPLNAKEDHVPKGATLAAVTNMSLTYASPRLISATADSWVYAGGAHGNSETTAINVDLAQGRVLTIGDMFQKAAMPTLQTECEKQIRVQKTEKMGGEFNPADDPNYSTDAVSKQLALMSAWSFTATAATVNFEPYAIGSYAEGAYHCTFPTSMLRPLAKPGAALPQ